jgi:hypothetical protein
MAKKIKEIASVELKDPSTELVLRNGMHITKHNLTIERYEKLVSLSEEFKDLFIVKLTPKKDEMESKK